MGCCATTTALSESERRHFKQFESAILADIRDGAEALYPSRPNLLSLVGATGVNHSPFLSLIRDSSNLDRRKKFNSFDSPTEMKATTLTLPIPSKGVNSSSVPTRKLDHQRLRAEAANAEPTLPLFSPGDVIELFVLCPPAIAAAKLRLTGQTVQAYTASVPSSIALSEDTEDGRPKVRRRGSTAEVSEQTASPLATINVEKEINDQSPQERAPSEGGHQRISVVIPCCAKLKASNPFAGSINTKGGFTVDQVLRIKVSPKSEEKKSPFLSSPTDHNSAAAGSMSPRIPMMKGTEAPNFLYGLQDLNATKAADEDNSAAPISGGLAGGAGNNLQANNSSYYETPQPDTSIPIVPFGDICTPRNTLMGLLSKSNSGIADAAQVQSSMALLRSIGGASHHESATRQTPFGRAVPFTPTESDNDPLGNVQPLAANEHSLLLTPSAPVEASVLLSLSSLLNAIAYYKTNEILRHARTLAADGSDSSSAVLTPLPMFPANVELMSTVHPQIIAAFGENPLATQKLFQDMLNLQRQARDLEKARLDEPETGKQHSPRTSQKNMLDFIHHPIFTSRLTQTPMMVNFRGLKLSEDGQNGRPRTRSEIAKEAAKKKSLTLVESQISSMFGHQMGLASTLSNSNVNNIVGNAAVVTAAERYNEGLVSNLADFICGQGTFHHQQRQPSGSRPSFMSSSILTSGGSAPNKQRSSNASNKRNSSTAGPHTLNSHHGGVESHFSDMLGATLEKYPLCLLPISLPSVALKRGGPAGKAGAVALPIPTGDQLGAGQPVTAGGHTNTVNVQGNSNRSLPNKPQLPYTISDLVTDHGILMLRKGTPSTTKLSNSQVHTMDEGVPSSSELTSHRLICNQHRNSQIYPPSPVEVLPSGISPMICIVRAVVTGTSHAPTSFYSETVEESMKKSTPNATPTVSSSKQQGTVSPTSSLNAIKGPQDINGLSSNNVSASRTTENNGDATWHSPIVGSPTALSAMFPTASKATDYYQSRAPPTCPRDEWGGIKGLFLQRYKYRAPVKHLKELSKLSKIEGAATGTVRQENSPKESKPRQFNIPPDTEYVINCPPAFVRAAIGKREVQHPSFEIREEGRKIEEKKRALAEAAATSQGSGKSSSKIDTRPSDKHKHLSISSSGSMEFTDKDADDDEDDEGCFKDDDSLSSSESSITKHDKDRSKKNIPSRGSKSGNKNAPGPLGSRSDKSKSSFKSTNDSDDDEDEDVFRRPNNKKSIRSNISSLPQADSLGSSGGPKYRLANHSGAPWAAIWELMLKTPNAEPQGIGAVRSSPNSANQSQKPITLHGMLSTIQRRADRAAAQALGSWQRRLTSGLHASTLRFLATHIKYSRGARPQSKSQNQRSDRNSPVIGPSRNPFLPLPHLPTTTPPQQSGSNDKLVSGVKREFLEARPQNSGDIMTNSAIVADNTIMDTVLPAIYLVTHNTAIETTLTEAAASSWSTSRRMAIDRRQAPTYKVQFFDGSYHHCIPLACALGLEYSLWTSVQKFSEELDEAKAEADARRLVECHNRSSLTKDNDASVKPQLHNSGAGGSVLPGSNSTLRQLPVPLLSNPDQPSMIADSVFFFSGETSSLHGGFGSPLANTAHSSETDSYQLGDAVLVLTASGQYRGRITFVWELEGKATTGAESYRPSPIHRIGDSNGNLAFATVVGNNVVSPSSSENSGEKHDNGGDGDDDDDEGLGSGNDSPFGNPLSGGVFTNGPVNGNHGIRSKTANSFFYNVQTDLGDFFVYVPHCDLAWIGSVTDTM